MTQPNTIDAPARTPERDPVCGMAVDSARAPAKFDHAGKTYYFCCQGCATKFAADPQKYLHAKSPASAHGDGALLSLGGIQPGGGVMTYRASKAAVIMFTKSAAIELAHYEVRVNAIAPGNIPTPLLKTTTTDKSPEELERFEHAIREQMRADRPLKREGTTDDIAEAALYLAGNRSRYVTGVVLPVDGGTVAGKVTRRRSETKD